MPSVRLTQYLQGSKPIISIFMYDRGVPGFLPRAFHGVRADHALKSPRSVSRPWQLHSTRSIAVDRKKGHGGELKDLGGYLTSLRCQSPLTGCPFVTARAQSSTPRCNGSGYARAVATNAHTKTVGQARIRAQSSCVTKEHVQVQLWASIIFCKHDAHSSFRVYLVNSPKRAHCLCAAGTVAVVPFHNRCRWES